MNRTTRRALVGAKDRTFAGLLALESDVVNQVTAALWGGRVARLKTALAHLPAEVLAKLDEIDASEVSSDFVQHLEVRLTELGVEVSMVQEITVRADGLGLGTAPAPDLPIGSDPAVAGRIAAARVHDVIDLAALPAQACEALARLAPTTRAIDDALLERLVQEERLSDAQARTVGYSLALYELSDDHLELAAAIRGAAFPRLGGAPAGSTRDLSRLAPDEWKAFFREHRAALPPGVTPASAARGMARRFAALHPGVALTARLPPIEQQRVLAALRLMAPLSARNRLIFSVAFTDLDLEGIERPLLPDLRAEHATMTGLARAYPGLELAAVLDDPQRDPAWKASEVARRVALVRDAAEHLGDADPLRADLAKGSRDPVALGLERLGADAGEQQRILEAFRAYQRAFAATKDVDVAHALVGSGYTSASSAGADPLPAFMKKTGLAPAKAHRVWENARWKMAGAALTAAGMLHATWPYGKYVGLSPASAGKFAALDGYQDLFGQLSLCACSACQSILGPAAYFVDLMKYIDENLRAELQPNHPLDLKFRRPDLWTLELSCDNVDERIPTLDIVCEILEGYAAAHVATGPVFEAIASSVDSLRQPFHLPLARAGAYLAALGSSRGEVAEALGAGPEERAQAELGLSPAEYAAATVATSDLAALERLYDLANGASKVEAHELQTALGIDRAGLGRLVAAAFVKASGATVTFALGKRGPGSVQNDVEWVQGLTAGALDRMHRFGRIRTKTGWAIAELDDVLAALKVGDLDDAGVRALSSFRRLLGRLGVSPGDLAALLEGGSTADARRIQLARWLGRSAEDVAQALDLLDLDEVTSLDDVAALLDLDELRRESSLSLDAIAIATGHTPRDPAALVDPAAVAEAVAQAAETSLAFAGAVFASALGTSEQGSLDLLACLSDVPSALPKSSPVLVERLVDGRYRLRADADLDAPGFIMTVPASASVPVPPTATTAATTRPLTVAEVLAALRPYLASEVLARAVGRQLGVAREQVAALAELAGTPLGALEMAKAARGEDMPRLAQLVAAVDALRVTFSGPVWDARTGGAARLAFVREHPVAFGEKALPQTTASGRLYLDLSQLRGVVAYGAAAARVAAASGPGAATAADLDGALVSFGGGAFPVTSHDALGRVLGVTASEVGAFSVAGAANDRAGGALASLTRAADLARALGVSGVPLAALVSGGYAAIEVAAAELRTPLSDPARASVDLDAVEQPLREARRDALVEYLLRSTKPTKWRTKAELDHYFLVDVDAGGCATTSRVVAATLSAQLYVHRALMNLERSEAGDVALEMPADAAAEWAWRKNFRVWQANRKVFLWPENYLEPDLRDDKTPLFEELEKELLQTDIDDANVLDAYTRYLAGLEELSSLTVAGAYHEIARDSTAPLRDVLHLFGVTAGDPPIFYYRTAQNLRASTIDPEIAAVWSPWRRITVQITGRRLSPVVHHGRLHVFWTHISTRPLNKTEDGTSKFTGYTHNLGLRFTTLRPDATWTPPQDVTLYTKPSVFGPGAGQVRDGLTNGKPQYAPKDPVHSEAHDDYTLAGPNWDFVWARTGNDESLQVQFRNFVGYGFVDLFARRFHRAALDATAPKAQLLCAAKSLDTAKIGRQLGAALSVAYAGGSVDTTLVNALRSQLVAAEAAAPQGPLDWKPLFIGAPGKMPYPDPAFANAVIDEDRLDVLQLDDVGGKPYLQDGLYAERIADIPAQAGLLAVPGSEEDGLLQVGDDVVLLTRSGPNGGYVAQRLGTTVVRPMARSLFEDGLDGLLGKDPLTGAPIQLAFGERALPISYYGKISPKSETEGRLDFDGPSGVYLREIFGYIPFLVANALNGRGRYEAARRWYDLVFDPTAREEIDLTGVAPEEQAHRLLDRVWRYTALRGLDVERLTDMLTNVDALEAYRRDPFNPWAIARARPSALQRALVTKYVDNLLDWADSLFTQFTMESVSEASMLYLTASELLGDRPVELGECGVGAAPGTYATIGPRIDAFVEKVAKVETLAIGRRAAKGGNEIVSRSRYVALPVAVLDAMVSGGIEAIAEDDVPGDNTLPGDGAPANGGAAAPDRKLFRGLGWNEARTAGWGPALGNAAVKTPDPAGGRSFEHAWRADFPERAARFGPSVLRLAPMFCVPANAELLAYWDRIADRLFKIRHCLDIEGQERELALFAPELDAAEIVGMKEAGLGLEEVLGPSQGELPPYRFLYVLDRAKAFASALAGFGGAFLASLEKKEGEGLNRLRQTQQIALTRLATSSRRLEIDAASASLEAVRRQRDAAVARVAFYADQMGENRNAWERAESIWRHASGVTRQIETVMQLLAGSLHLIPQTGSPFAMKYGGVELGGSFGRFAAMVRATSGVNDSFAASASLEGSFERRRSGWAQQKEQADHDVATLDRQVRGAEIRLRIAERGLELHERGLEHAEEFLARTEGRFTNHGLYTWTAQRLQRLHVGAYKNALALAKLAERAYRFERGDDGAAPIVSAAWDPARGGLLAGEEALASLQTLERRFLETNHRSLEVDQAFALSQIDAKALVDLRETGTCTFSIDEVFFDLGYPGHFKRRIKAARLTVPCITGPYVNVGATLDLVSSQVRLTAEDGAALLDVPPSRSVSIATSTAQNDAGVFELSFRDERYMPFEGLGAVNSRWRLTLPKTFRQFDYQTINDVILSLSYTAEHDASLRARVERDSAAVEGAIVAHLRSTPTSRLISLRQDFSSAFTRLLRSPSGTVVKLELTDRNLPPFLRGRGIVVTNAALIVRTATGVSPSGFTLALDGGAVSPVAPSSALDPPPWGGLPAVALPPGALLVTHLLGEHTLAVTAAGGLAPGTTAPGDVAALDSGKLLDVLVHVEMKLA